MQGFTAQQQDEIRQIIREEIKAALTIKGSDIPRHLTGMDLTGLIKVGNPKP